jgi:hypothetical protein
VRHLTDQRRQGVGHQSRRGRQHFAALLGSDDEGLNVVDEPLVDAAKAVVEPVVQRVGVAEQQLGSVSKNSNVARTVARNGASAYPNRAPLAASATATWVRRAYSSAAIKAWNRASLDSKYW